MNLYDHGLRYVKRPRQAIASMSPAVIKLDDRIWQYRDELASLVNNVATSSHGCYRGSGIADHRRFLQNVQVLNCSYDREKRLLRIGEYTTNRFEILNGYVYLVERSVSFPSRLIDYMLDYATLESCVTELDRELQERGLTRGKPLAEELREDDFLALVRLDPNKLKAIMIRVQAEDIVRRYKPIRKQPNGDFRESVH